MVSTIASYQLVSNNIVKSLQQTLEKPDVSKDTEYYLAHIRDMKSIDDFLIPDRLTLQDPGFDTLQPRESRRPRHVWDDDDVEMWPRRRIVHGPDEGLDPVGQVAQVIEGVPRGDGHGQRSR